MSHENFSNLFFLFYFIFKLYIIVLVLPNIKMNPNLFYGEKLFYLLCFVSDL